ncbi:zinc transporter ZupT [Romboutsia ilealis]|uniref:Zinc transporter ZupT n=1 Tax=Romboutsia faecis TaxID=2764597 RepID=A0ABR7JJS6_9FIRM|nr:zinc transporter ZupT [Romboutsia faecis]MBC5995178.1 zinc transporter ZupT [Romboutsia faecis]MRN25896.1 zinc transporter ZupT [Romboutsia ilealis]
MGSIAFAFMLTAIAGLSTGIGSCIAFFSKTENKKFLSVTLGFSAGVMIYVSMIEIFSDAKHKLSISFGDKIGTGITIIAFFIGILLILLIDKFIPSESNPHEVHDTSEINDSSLESNKSEINDSSLESNKLLRTGVFTALAIGIHNFPEGIATFVSALQDFSIAIPIVVAIAIHNIPEGISVSVPIYYATGSKKKAFIYSFISGLAEPIGALVGYLILMPIMNDTVFGVLFASVAGIMVFISLDELLPLSREYGKGHLSIYGLVAGMAVMAISLWLFM